MSNYFSDYVTTGQWDYVEIDNVVPVNDEDYIVEYGEVNIVYESLTANRTVTLPPAAHHAGKRITVTDGTGTASIFNITVVPQGTDTIDGGASYTLVVNWASVTFLSDGTQWLIVYNTNENPINYIIEGWVPSMVGLSVVSNHTYAYDSPFIGSTMQVTAGVGQIEENRWVRFVQDGNTKFGLVVGKWNSGGNDYVEIIPNTSMTTNAISSISVSGYLRPIGNLPQAEFEKTLSADSTVTGGAGVTNLMSFEVPHGRWEVELDADVEIEFTTDSEHDSTGTIGISQSGTSFTMPDRVNVIGLTKDFVYNAGSKVKTHAHIKMYVDGGNTYYVNGEVTQAGVSMNITGDTCKVKIKKLLA